MNNVSQNVPFTNFITIKETDQFNYSFASTLSSSYFDNNLFRTSSSSSSSSSGNKNSKKKDNEKPKIHGSFRFKRFRRFFKIPSIKSSSSSTLSSLSVESANFLDNYLTCKICFEKYELNSTENQIFQIDSCKCQFCKNCLNQYVKQCIENNDVMPLNCPDSNCSTKGHLNQFEIKDLLLKNNLVINLNTEKPSKFDTNNNNLNQNSDNTDENTKLFRRYLNICQNIEILRDRHKTFCPKPDCQNVCLIQNTTESKNLIESIKVHCDKCNHEFCSFCSKKWFDTNLNDLEKQVSSNKNIFNNEKELEYCDCLFNENENSTIALHGRVVKSLIGNFENIKRCPKCCTLIERAQGCPQIMCKICRHTFCFYCLTSLDNDFLLKHYTKNGPCKGKLGHSRFSLLLHQISVVALFIGTIALLILISPFLLLTLPIFFLNSKFRKVCFKYFRLA